MSEIHPSAPTLKKGRGSHRLRQVIDHWPLLVWLVIFSIAIYGYNKGIVFDRMNGVVDVYQESIAPSEDGIFLGLGDGIETGKVVNAGDVIAKMDPTMVKLEISRFEERRKLSSQGTAEKAHDRLVDLKQDLWEAEEELKLLGDELAGLETQIGLIGNSPALQPAKSKLQLDVRMVGIKKESRTNQVERLKEAVAERQEILERLSQGGQAEIPMDAEDQKQLEMMKLREERTLLKARRAGIVDRILKEPGEFIEAGESIAKVVADPTHILGFLPQQELTAVTKGTEVWVTSATDRSTENFKSTVLDLSPRIDSVRDAASPLPNQAVRGRTILITYPPESKFLPGQPVIIHLKKPGNLSLLSKFFGLF